MLRLAGYGTRSRLVNAGTTFSNDVGEFRVATLAPGAYLVRADPLGTSRRLPGDANDKPEEVLRRTYYPSTADQTAATRLVLGPGEMRSGITITVLKAASYRIQGTVVGLPDDVYYRSVSLALVARAGADPMRYGVGQLEDATAPSSGLE